MVNKTSSQSGTDYRKLIVSLVIGVLFTIFVFTSIAAVYPDPEYDCYDDYPRYYLDDRQNMTDAQWQLREQELRECSDAHQQAREQHSFMIFLISSITGLIVLILAMYLPITNGVGMAIASGLLMGGLLTIFIGTIGGWSGIGQYVRPVVILVELVLVIWVAYKKLQ